MHLSKYLLVAQESITVIFLCFENMSEQQLVTKETRFPSVLLESFFLYFSYSYGNFMQDFLLFYVVIHKLKLLVIYFVYYKNTLRNTQILVYFVYSKSCNVLNYLKPHHICFETIFIILVVKSLFKFMFLIAIFAFLKTYL